MFNMRKSKSEARSAEEPGPVFSAPATKETRRDAAWLASRLARSKMFGPKEMETETVEITPALAELMYQHNTKNRKITKAKRVQYAKDLKAGQWKLHHQGIAFDRNGVLADGQHRLLAIIDTGITATCRVTFGVDPEAFRVIDTGKARGASDTLQIAGYKYWIILAAGARVYAIVTSPTPLGNISITNEQVLEIVSERPLMGEVCADAQRIAAALHIPAGGLVAALFLIRQAAGNTVKYTDFVDRLSEGDNLAKNSPILIFRKMCSSRAFNDAHNSGNKASRIAGTLIVCWNKWVTGKTASNQGSITWDGTRTPFPGAEPR